MNFPSTRHDTRHGIRYDISSYSGRVRRTAIALAAATTAISPMVAAPALAEEPAPSRVSAIPSQFQVDPGEQFVIRGRMLSEGEPVVGAPVLVRTWTDDGLVNIDGAHVITDSEGRYRVRIVLHRKGDRLLKVVANPTGDDIRTARRNVLMQVGPMPENP